MTSTSTLPPYEDHGRDAEIALLLHRMMGEEQLLMALAALA